MRESERARIEAVEHSLGEENAPFTVVEYGDYECPFCAAAAPVLRELVEESDGRVRLIFRNFPLFEVHPYALAAALAAESTVEFGAFWRMHELLFRSQDRLGEADLRRYAETVGADPHAAVGEPAQRFAPKVQHDYEAGIADGARGTPTVFVNGSQLSGRVELATLRRATGGSGRLGRSPG